MSLGSLAGAEAPLGGGGGTPGGGIPEGRGAERGVPEGGGPEGLAPVGCPRVLLCRATTFASGAPLGRGKSEGGGPV